MKNKIDTMMCNYLISDINFVVILRPRNISILEKFCTL